MNDFFEYRESLSGIDESILRNNLIEMAYIMEVPLSESVSLVYGQGRLDEAVIGNAVNKALQPVGFQAKKGNRSLLKYISDAAKGVGKFFLAVIKGDFQTAGEIARSLKLQDVVDFLLRLDKATFSIITGTFDRIEAITGWDIWASLESAKETVKQSFERVNSAIENIKRESSLTMKTTKGKKKLVSALERIKQLVVNPKI